MQNLKTSTPLFICELLE